MRSTTTTLILAVAVLAAPLATEAQQQSYTNPVYRWSISYPADWTLDNRDPRFVRILSPADKPWGLCGIHSGSPRVTTLDEFTDFLLADNKRRFKERGLLFAISARRPISLPNGIIGNDVLADILPGGRSRRIYVLADGRGLIVDCETYARLWRELEPVFNRIINSFTPGE